MKKAVSILVSILLLGSGLQLSLDRHFCDGKMVDVKVSFTGKMASCGMEDDQQDLFDYQVIKTNCCEDEIILYGLDNSFYPEFNNIHSVDPIKVIYQKPSDIINSYNIQVSNLLKLIFPSGNEPGSTLTQSEICVFRI
jgi:hypothetical protein